MKRFLKGQNVIWNRFLNWLTEKVHYKSIYCTKCGILNKKATFFKDLTEKHLEFWNKIEGDWYCAKCR